MKRSSSTLTNQATQTEGPPKGPKHGGRVDTREAEDLGSVALTCLVGFRAGKDLQEHLRHQRFTATKVLLGEL